MTPTLVALSRELVAHPRWRWAPGMRWTLPDASVLAMDRVPDIPDRGDPLGLAALRSLGWSESDAAPDLTDAATAGVLLAMAIEDSRGIGRGWRSFGLNVEGAPGPADTYRFQHIDPPSASLGECAARALLWWWARLDETEVPRG